MDMTLKDTSQEKALIHQEHANFRAGSVLNRTLTLPG